jgi:GT2 family glycosyltransferase
MSETQLRDISPAPLSDEYMAGGPPGRKPASPLKGSTAVIVLGMHRSGTSALAGTLRRLGVDLGDCLMRASPDNPRGYWEHREIVAANHGIMAKLGWAWDDIRPLPAGWEGGEVALGSGLELSAILERDFAAASLWGLKDPRLCRLLPLWTALFAQLEVRPHFILALRHPLDAAASLAARDRLSAARAGLLWLRHILEAERHTRGYPRTIVHYEDLVGRRGWRSVVSQIAKEIGLVWPGRGPLVERDVDAFLAPELWHHRTSEPNREIADAGGIQGWLRAVYFAFTSAEDARLRDTCDAVHSALDDAGELFLPIIDEAAQKLAPGGAQPRAQDHTTELAERLARAEHQAAELRALVFCQDGELKALKRQSPAIPSRGLGLLPPIAVEEAFPHWIESRASTALAHVDWIDERIGEWPFAPKLALGMIVPAGNEARVALTLRSLILQKAGDWELHVAAEGDMPEFFAAEPRLFWHREAGRAVDWLNRRLAHSNAHWVALIDAGDQLAPHAIFSVADAFFRHSEWSAAYSDEDRIDFQDERSGPHFKPDFNLDLMRSLPYVGGLLAVRRELFAQLEGFDAEQDGLEEYDLALRLAERLGASGFGHIADILYHRLTSSGRSTRPVDAICADMPRVVQAHLDRSGIAATAEPGAQPHFCRVRYHHEGPEPLVSIVIPTRDQITLLRRCIETVLRITEYQNYELIIVDNGSTEPEALEYLRNIDVKAGEIGGRIRVLRHPGNFNFSIINNRAVQEAACGEYICLLNNDVAPLEGAWLGEMMALARRPDVGVVGAKLLYPGGRIQHGGVILGVGGGAPAEHPYNGEPEGTFGYWGRLQVVQSLSVVTAACLVTRRSIYQQVGGLDAEHFAVAYNDVDYCLRVGAAGYLVVWTPFAKLLHEGSASLRSDLDGRTVEEKNARFAREKLAIYRKWMPRIAFDPAYNRNLSSLGLGFAIETEGAPTWDPEFRPRARALVYPADREGCGEYRIIAPSRALLRSGLVHCCETMRLATPPEVARIAPDSIVFQRQLEWHQIEVIEQVKNTSAAFRVFELDDLITNLPLKSVHRKAMAPDISERLKKALSLCNRLIVSTEPLACSYGKLCDEAVVVSNRLEKARWLGLSPKRRLDKRPRVGWAGAVGHFGDLTLIASVVEATAREVDWVFFGMCPDRLKRWVAEYHEWVPLHDYAEKLASLDLDLAVAPLEPHPFNEAKSNLRLLEYGVLGYAVLCTDILPYQCDLPVVRVANRHRSWVTAIRDMVADREACQRAGEQLRATVVENWMLEDHLEEWRRAWLP